MKSFSVKVKNYFKIMKLVFVLLLFIMLSGCASSTFNLTVNPNKLSNSKQPFYVIVKQESMYDYLDSSVNTVYDNYLKKGSNDASFLIYPEKGKQTIPIEKSDKDGISIYFLFQKESNSGNWKFYINPNNQKDKTVNISKNNVMEVL
ncbi:MULTISPECIES: type VI secretion system lipoprotein IglE [unclassified Francisella]|uniref:type VI secretion system lipoprotein IglE n=1 Tax=unclassified Francisella TaxID=2610885 RepID=UPI002E37FE15|nr:MULTISPECIES: type VI secretion system lipoprotein IglE [unclassified Francisella]MED7818889.1 type VI secretion system lipoprotein IglE [Francisella sp. 19S2-4]MED7829726.1 type VI secretion system lipoprotein IglE [Francisella sp. 19S2-10]